MVMFTPEKIRELRKALGWSAHKLALHLGVTENAVRRWEAKAKYARHPKWETMEKLNDLAEQVERTKSNGKRLAIAK